MKRTKFLALALVVALMMMGAGYAYWTQDLTIQNTVNTGELDVQFTELELDVEGAAYMGSASSFLPADTDGEYNLKLDLIDAYPGAGFTVSFDLANTGTLAANVRNFDITDTNNNADLVLVRSYTVGNSTESLTTDTTLQEVLDAFNALNDNEGISVEYDDSVSVELVLEINPDADNQVDSDLYLEEDVTGAISFTINATAYQYNEI
ncbi:hypothetical protein Amet_0493 [Alkaliphilus metalliredigens QYMF]|uniref:Uncharacterized protein n=1 Tax=Alkaliphilus metalliredigens (strain QYMF) TaxID=293826 RepID=A6TKK2_ALKMQ|nr:hypothetical protein [Alkaliphilus metalliredigens]ABR46720.1 hypothetical protein Amet_0493 [Alkaliphilus metalliredigens QYMF]